VVLKVLAARGRKQLARFRSSGHLVDWPGTRAYAVKTYHPGAGIQVNLRGRQPQGTVAPGAEYEHLREAILVGLRGLRDPDSGATLIEEAHRREDVYSGP